MTVFTVYWLSGSARAPTRDQFEQFDFSLLTKEVGKEGGPVVGVFGLRRHAYREAGWSLRPVQVFVAPAVQF